MGYIQDFYLNLKVSFFLLHTVMKIKFLQRIFLLINFFVLLSRNRKELVMGLQNYDICYHFLFFPR